MMQAMPKPMPSASVAEDEALAAALDESLAAAFPGDEEQPPPPSAGVIVETFGSRSVNSMKWNDTVTDDAVPTIGAPQLRLRCFRSH